ncbi:MAG: hypothetical protein EA414_01850 [Arthrospira sp. PLM2.Bin9]|nr:hypothetical protein [Arthrospira sp. PLM2.Bin9]TVU55417.1 MAG: hypothetical protein EA414_01850 [Arthrospira sp. PLM2.Bin9]
MNTIVNYHVIDPKNIGDLFSSPVNYFEFPGYEVIKRDIRTLDNSPPLEDPESLLNHHAIVGGGGLMFDRFLPNFQRLQAGKNGNSLILWGAGQQVYQLKNSGLTDGSHSPYNNNIFDYTPYLKDFNCIGIRDYNQGYDWVPCVSCMDKVFDKEYSIQEEFVVFSHKKFQLKIDSFPRMTNEGNNFEEIISFLASGETILTSSFHGAYWGTLLGRKVLAFPFTSKFLTLKHPVAMYPGIHWKQPKREIKILGKTLYQRFDESKFLCSTDNWRSHLKHCQSYPESLQECRDRNNWFYQQVMNHLNAV